MSGTDLIAEGNISATAVVKDGTGAAETSDKDSAGSLWPHACVDTVNVDAFYRDVSRTGITYGPCFRMVQKASTDGSQALMR